MYPKDLPNKKKKKKKTPLNVPPFEQPASIFQMGGGGMTDSATKIANLLTEESWKAVLQPEFKKPNFTNLVKVSYIF
jgi:hypothetical protein